jgi:hypothetical protein
MEWHLSRSSLYRMAYQGHTPSASKLVKFLDTYASTGLDPARPNSSHEYGVWPLWDKVAEALTEFWMQSDCRFGPDPIFSQIMDRWVPILLAKPELKEKVIYPLAHIYPSYEKLHEMGAWDRSVSPYDLLAGSTPKWVSGFSKFLLEKYADKFKGDPGAPAQIGAWRKAASTTTLYSMKNHHIGSATLQNEGANLVPKKVLAEKAARLTALAFGSSSNLHWEYGTSHYKAKSLPDELFQFGRFDIASLQQDFSARLRSGPFPCTVQATFTPELKRRYDEARKYRANYLASSPSVFDTVDEILLNDLFCYAIASEVNLKWTDTQLLAIALYYHVPLHCLLLWVMEAAVVYRRRFATDHTVMSVKRNICEFSNISLPVYDEAFYRPYAHFTNTLSSSKASRYCDMKAVADRLIGIDPDKIQRGEEPVEELSAFYEMIIGAPNNYATNPLSDREIKRIENRNDPEVVRPSDLHGYDPDEDDDEPAVSLLDALASSEDDEDEGFFIPQTPEGERFRLPSKEEYKPFWEKDDEPQPSSPSSDPSPSPSPSQSDNVTEDEK